MLLDRDWAPVRLGDVFDEIERGRRIVSANHEEGEMPLVSSMGINNGVTGFVGNTRGVRIFGNCLTVANGGASAGKCFYQPFDFVASDHVTHCKRDGLGSDGYRMAAVCMTQAMVGKFSFSHELKDDQALRERTMLPVDKSGCPDWEYMNEYSASMRAKLLERYRMFVVNRLSELEFREVPSLDEVEWDRFRVFGETGYLRIATTNSSIDGIRLIEGDDDMVPYVTRSDKNNGISRFVSTKNYEFGSDDGGCIIVGLDTQTAFWQPMRFVTGQNVHVITGDVLNEHVAMFLLPLFVTQMRAKFNWGGNGATLGRMEKLEMVLPVGSDGDPDWIYMEQYAINMMKRKYEQYLVYLDNQQSLDNSNA